MNIGRTLFLAILLISGSTILAGGSVVEKINHDVASYRLSGDEVLESLQQQTDLRMNYQEELVVALGKFSENQINYTQLEEELLNLKVPAEYKDLHFSLVNSVDQLIAGQDKNEIKFRLEKIGQSYLWLTKVMSFIVGNNL